MPEKIEIHVDNVTHEKLQLYQSHEVSVDYFRSKLQQIQRVLVVTFTERGNRSLSGFGFGGRFLLNNDFDVIAVKSIKLTWFEELDADIIETIGATIDRQSNCYSLRVCYGSSMGAYAAIRYSKFIKADRVIAISPLFDIRFAEDRRYSSDISGLTKSEMMGQKFIRAECSYFLMFDPKSQDRLHIKKYTDIIDSNTLHPISIPYSGHPSGFFLSETGVLQDLILSIIDGQIPNVRDLTKFSRAKSTWYLLNLAQACYIARKLRWALSLTNKAKVLSPTNPEIHTLISKICCKLGLWPDAETAAMVAIQCDAHPHRKMVLIDVLFKLSAFERARDLLDKMIELAPHVEHYHRLRAIASSKLMSE